MSKPQTFREWLGGRSYVDAYTCQEAWNAASQAERDRCARLCESAVETLMLPDAPAYEGDVRPVEMRVALSLADAIRKQP